MKLTKDIVINHLRRANAFLWSLYLIQDYRKTHILTFKGDGINENDNNDSKAEKSINRLNAILADFPQNAVFAIELKASNTANGNGIIGPLEFVNTTKEEQTDLGALQNTTPSNFAAPPHGYVSEEYLNGRLESIKAENQKAINDLMYKNREENFNREMKAREQKLAELERELKDEKRKYESHTGQAAEALFTALKKIVSEFIPTKPQATQLAAPQTDEVTPQTQEEKEKHAAVTRLASMLYEKSDTQTINKLFNELQKNANTNIKE